MLSGVLSTGETFVVARLRTRIRSEMLGVKCPGVIVSGVEFRGVFFTAVTTAARRRLGGEVEDEDGVPALSGGGGGVEGVEEGCSSSDFDIAKLELGFAAVKESPLLPSKGFAC